jgi:mono/diheme cytochrome c family protein
VALLYASSIELEPIISAAQAESGKSETASPPAKTEAGTKLFAQYCAKCHGADGKGQADARKIYPEIPDFSDANFQRRRTDTQFSANILDGKGDSMPGFKGKITADQARALVKYVRKFAPMKQDKKENMQTQDVRRFHEQFEELLKQFEDLRKEFRQLLGAPRVRPVIEKTSPILPPAPL